VVLADLGPAQPREERLGLIVSAALVMHAEGRSVETYILNLLDGVRHGMYYSCSLEHQDLISPPGAPWRLLLVGVTGAVKAALASPARGAERGGGQGGAGPATAERGAPGLWSPLAPGPRRIPRPPPALRAVPSAGAPGAGDGGRPRRAAPWRPETVLGREQLGFGLQALP
jgi:hypothetical protein